MKKGKQGTYDTSATTAGNTMYPNVFQHPNVLVDRFMYLLTPEENTVLTFAVREILGWERNRMARRARIALSCFVKGTEKDGKMVNHGTGLSKKTVHAALEGLTKHAILIKYDSNRDGTEWELNWEIDTIKLPELIERYEQRRKKNMSRSVNGLVAANDKLQERRAKAKHGGPSDATH